MAAILGLTMNDIEESFRQFPVTKVPCLFHGKLHPRYPALLLQGEAWAEERLAPVLPESTMNNLRRSYCAALAGYLWPDAKTARAATLVKFCYWIVVFDDVADDPLGDGGDIQRLQRFCDHFIEAVFGGGEEDSSGLFSREERLSVALAKEWWGDMTREGGEAMAPPALQARIAQAVIAYARSQLRMVDARSEWEEWIRRRGQGQAEPLAGGISLDELVKEWRTVSSAYLILVLCEYSLGIELDSASAAVQHMIDGVADHLNWVNNIFSFPKDLLKQEPLNFLYPLHLLHQPARPFHATLAQAWDVVAAIERDCQQHANCVCEQERLYADALCTLAASNILWHMLTPRYPHTQY